MVRMLLNPDRDMRLMSIHWTLDPSKVQGAYFLDKRGGRHDLPDIPSAYQAFLDGKAPRSPWYDLQVRRTLGSGGGMKEVSQELDINFVASGALVFDEARLKAGYQGSTDPKYRWLPQASNWLDVQHDPTLPKRTKLWGMTQDILRVHSFGTIWVWKEPDPTRMYVVFGDSTEGGDKASIAVCDSLDLSIVASGRGVWPPEQFAVILCALGYTYNEAFLMLENNSVGMATLAIMTGRIAVQEDEDVEYLKQGWMYQRLGTEWKNDRLASTHTLKLGFRTTTKTKPQLIAATRRTMEVRTDFCPDRRFWEEAMGFIELDNGKTTNPSGDDLLVAVMGALFFAPEARQFKPITLEQRTEKHKDWADFNRSVKKGNFEHIMQKRLERRRWQLSAQTPRPVN